MPKKRVRVVKDWQCQECGKLLTLKQAERALSNAQGCPNCGGADIDLAPLSEVTR